MLITHRPQIAKLCTRTVALNPRCSFASLAPRLLQRTKRCTLALKVHVMHMLFIISMQKDAYTISLGVAVADFAPCSSATAAKGTAGLPPHPTCSELHPYRRSTQRQRLFCRLCQNMCYPAVTLHASIRIVFIECLARLLLNNWLNNKRDY